MPYSISWLKEKRVLSIKLEGSMEFEESVQAAQDTNKHLDEGQAPVHLIVDVTNQTKYPTNVKTVYEMCGFLGNKNLGWVVVVGANAIIGFISRIVTQIAKVKLTTRNTVDEAMAYLEKLEVELPAVKSP